MVKTTRSRFSKATATVATTTKAKVTKRQKWKYYSQAEFAQDLLKAIPIQDEFMTLLFCNLILLTKILQIFLEAAGIHIDNLMGSPRFGLSS